MESREEKPSKSDLK